MTQCKHLAMTHLVEGSEYNMLYVLMLRDVYTAVASLTETQSSSLIDIHCRCLPGTTHWCNCNW